MFELKFKEQEDIYLIDDFSQSGNIVTIKSEKSIPDNTSGFYLSREGKGDRWDYTKFTTIYRKLSKTEIQFSNDGSVYVPPKKDITVSVNWQDGDNVYQIRPESVTITVLKDGKKSVMPELSEENHWKKLYKDRPADSEFTIEAPDLEKYQKDVSGTSVTYSVYIPQPRQVSTDDVARCLVSFYEKKEVEGLENIYAAYCENGIKNFFDVPARIAEKVNEVITADGFMVNEDGTVSLRPINQE